MLCVSCSFVARSAVCSSTQTFFLSSLSVPNSNCKIFIMDCTHGTYEWVNMMYAARLPGVLFGWALLSSMFYVLWDHRTSWKTWVRCDICTIYTILVTWTNGRKKNQRSPFFVHFYRHIPMLIIQLRIYQRASYGDSTKSSITQNVHGFKKYQGLELFDSWLF